MFRCGMNIYYLDDSDNYIIVKPGMNLFLGSVFDSVEWVYERMDTTYAEWLDARNRVKREDYIEDEIRQIVLMSEKEFSKGLRY